MFVVAVWSLLIVNFCGGQKHPAICFFVSRFLVADAAHAALEQVAGSASAKPSPEKSARRKLSTTTTQSTTDEGYQAMVAAAKEELEAAIQAEKNWEEAWIRYAANADKERGRE